MHTLRFGITLGDPSGVGPEIALKATRELGDRVCCILYGEERVLRKAAAIVGDDRPLHAVADARDYAPGAVNYVQIASLPGDYELGRVQASCGKAAYDYLERAIRDAMAGDIDAVVTCPLNKEALNLAGLHYAGHTEILGRLTGAENYAMVLDGKGLRVIHVSTHVSLREACDRATRERILRTIRLAHGTAAALAGTESPRLAVAGLNPHNSEGGLFGWEEEREIIPAVEDARAEGFTVTGPVSPDTVFVRALKGEFDMVVAMYHDQGHIPLKLVDFMGGVNITVGLPIVRTSVDHGTAFDLAGTGRADHSSLLAAVDAAGRLAAFRRQAPRYVLVADDLTGANDTGVQLTKHGLEATVRLAGDASLPQGSASGALVLDTESRNLPGVLAAQRLDEVGQTLSAWAGRAVFYKKVDSTMRGNLAEEVNALARSLNLRTVVFTPAFPRNGRVVRQGHLYVDGVSVDETAFARDPLKPVASARLSAVMAGLAPLPIFELPLTLVRKPELPEAFAAEGCYCCDAEHEADLLALVRAVLSGHRAEDVLWVGSAGLAEALLTANGEPLTPSAGSEISGKGPVLLVLGSLNAANREQAEAALHAGEVELIRLDTQAVNDDPRAELDRLSRDAVAVLRTGRNPLIASSWEPEDVLPGASGAIAQLMGELVRDIVGALPPGGLYLTGGDVAVHVLRALDCASARIVREVEPGIPLIRLEGGLCPGVPVVTKAGAFGNARTLRRCLEVLNGRG